MNPYMHANYFYSLCFFVCYLWSTNFETVVEKSWRKAKDIERDVSSTENAFCLVETFLYEQCVLNLIFAGQSSFDT